MNLFEKVFKKLSDKKKLEKFIKMKSKQFNLEYLKRCKKSSPESKFQWLMAALKFGKTKKIIISRKKV